MEKKLKASNDNRIDYGVILPVFLLCLIGLLSLYVALSHDPNNPAVLKGVGMQVVWYLVGAAAIVVIMHSEFQMDLETDSLPLWFGVSGNGTLAQIL